jgi:hypothetical protein
LLLGNERQGEGERTAFSYGAFGPNPPPVLLHNAATDG